MIPLRNRRSTLFARSNARFFTVPVNFFYNIHQVQDDTLTISLTLMIRLEGMHRLMSSYMRVRTSSTLS